MPIDREAALKKAEKLLRQGKLDGAIEEYVRLIDDQPRDWNAINALGDLYVRAGDAERAVAQFTRVADHLFHEGFLPRAAALYKKALKVHGQHAHTLSQLADIAARQGVLVDAKNYLRQLEAVRRQRGDEEGVADCRRRLAALDETDTAPAPATPALPPSAVRPTPAARPPMDEVETLLADAKRELIAGHELQASALLTRVLTLDPDRHADVVRLALDLARRGRIDSAHGCIDVAADAALIGGDGQRAAEALEAFAAITGHIPALLKLVEVCGDAGLEARMRAAQEQLADAYLDAASGHEARAVAVDLLEADPDNPIHLARLRQALELLGVPAPEPPKRREPADEAAAAPHAMEVDLTDALAAVPPAPEPPATYATGDAVTALETAARDPRTGATAAASLGRLHVQRGDLALAIQWFERAADGPFATPDEGFAVLYEMADALERLGEPARALALFVGLWADAGDYRDLRARIEQLSRQAAAPTAGTPRGRVESGRPGR